MGPKVPVVAPAYCSEKKDAQLFSEYNSVMMAVRAWHGLKGSAVT